jgi:hypothetical protein
MAGSSFPASPPQTPGFPANPQPITWDGFDTLNTKPSRPAIGDQEMYICNGWMPLGKSNLRTLWGINPTALYSGGSKTIANFTFANIGNTQICMVFLSDGSIVQVNTTTGGVTSVAPASTITTPTGPIGGAQWGGQYVLITAPQTNGYFVWDGTLFYQSGTVGPQVDIQSDGYDYTSAPTVTAIGGHGSGVILSATVQDGSIESINVTNQGSGYKVSDALFLAFSGGGGELTAILTSTISGGSVTGTSVTLGGTGYTSTSAVQFLGGGGFGAAGSVVTSGGAVSSISLSSGGQGYTSAPTPYVTDNNNPVAEATIDLMPFGVQGTALEVYESRVWIVNGSAPTSTPPQNLVLFTAPGSPTDFSPADGAGSFLSTDSFLKVGYVNVKQSNGFLYLIGDSSINYISNPQTTGSPPITTFSNQNVDPQIGTPWPNTVQVFSRNIAMANTFGVHVSYGGAVTKVSDMLDGIFSSATPTGSPPTFSGMQPSSAVATIFGIHVYMVLMPVNSPGYQQANYLMMWDGKRWWTALQEVDLKQIATQEINSVMNVFGLSSSENAIYQLFYNDANTLTKTAQSKLWLNPGQYYTKMANRLYGLFTYYNANNGDIIVTIDNGTDEGDTVQLAGGQLTWENINNIPVSWINGSNEPMIWVISGFGVNGPIAISEQGAMIGITIETQISDMAVVSISIIEQLRQANV